MLAACLGVVLVSMTPELMHSARFNAWPEARSTPDSSPKLEKITGERAEQVPMSAGCSFSFTIISSQQLKQNSEITDILQHSGLHSALQVMQEDEISAIRQCLMFRQAVSLPTCALQNDHEMTIWCGFLTAVFHDDRAKSS